MPLPGGPAAKVGQRYELRWTVRCMLDVLEDRARSIRLEPPGHEGEGIEFKLFGLQREECHQVKRQSSHGAWRLGALREAGVLRAFMSHLQRGSKCVFVSMHAPPELQELIERADSFATWPEFEAAALKAQEWRKHFDLLCEAWELPSEDTYGLLKDIEIVTLDENTLAEQNRLALAQLFEAEPHTVADVLAQLALSALHRDLTAADIWEHLRKRGIRFKKLRWGFVDWLSERLDGLVRFFARVSWLRGQDRPALGSGSEALPLPKNNFRAAGIRPNAGFAGRKSELRRLHEQISRRDGPVFHAVIGEGGVGKTDLAIEYAHRHAADYAGVWWIDASRTSLHDSTARLAKVFEVGGRGSWEQIRQRLCAALSSGKHLLILDGAEDEKDVLEFHVEGPARVLVTTRRSRWPTDQVVALGLGVLDRAASVELLRRGATRAGRPKPKGKALREIAEYLGHLPLAVALVAEYLRKYPDADPAGVGRMLSALGGSAGGDAAAAEVLDEVEPSELGGRYNRRVAECLALHLLDLHEKPPRKVLERIAFCAPADVPIALLSDASGLGLPETRKALRALADLSLIRYESALIQVHRLTQWAVRTRLGSTEATDAVTDLARCLEQRLDSARGTAAPAPYAPHAATVLGFGERLTQ